MFNAFVFNGSKLVSEKCYDVKNHPDLLYYRGNITVKGTTHKNMFILVSRKNGMPVSYGIKLADAVKGLKKRTISDDSITRYEFFKNIAGADKLFVNICMSSKKGSTVATIEINTAEDIKFSQDKYVDDMITEILLSKKKNDAKVGIAGYSVYKSADDAKKKENCLYTQRYSKENCFKIENLYFGFINKKAA